MQQLVGEHEVDDTVLVNTRAEVLVVTSRETRSNTVVSVEHAGNTVETETVKVVLLHPEAEVTQQESQNLVVAVVEESAVPELVSALCALVEVEVVTAVEHVQAVKHILRSVTVNNIQEDGDAHAVGSVDELLQLIRQTVATACGEEAVDLVAETGVVCVLHDRHELDDVVAQMMDSRQCVLCELFVGSDLGVGRRDTNVGFVDTSTLWLRGLGVLESVTLVLRRVPEARIVDGRDVQVLGDSGNPCRYALLSGVIVGDDEGDLCEPVCQSVFN